MNLIKDIDPIYLTEQYDVILVGTNIFCSLGNGFQSKMKYKYPDIEKINLKTGYGDYRKLGKRITIPGHKEKGIPSISLLYICGYPNKNHVSIDYDALINALSTSNAHFNGKKVMTTVLGGTIFDGNGDKDKVLLIIEKYTPNLDLDVYDYEQKYAINETKEVLLSLYRENNDDNKFTLPIKEREKILRDKFLPILSFRRKWLE